MVRASVLVLVAALSLVPTASAGVVDRIEQILDPIDILQKVCIYDNGDFDLRGCYDPCRLPPLREISCQDP